MASARPKRTSVRPRRRKCSSYRPAAPPAKSGWLRGKSGTPRRSRHRLELDRLHLDNHHVGRSILLQSSWARKSTASCTREPCQRSKRATPVGFAGPTYTPTATCPRARAGVPEKHRAAEHARTSTAAADLRPPSRPSCLLSALQVLRIRLGTAGSGQDRRLARAQLESGVRAASLSLLYETGDVADRGARESSDDRP